MAKVSKVEGFDAFKAKISELTGEGGGGGDIFVYFSGAADQSGKSWCPDCVTAEPVVTVRPTLHITTHHFFTKHFLYQKNLAGAAEDSHFLYVAVGDRTFWKDQNNIFRTAKETQLKRFLLDN